MFIIKYYVIGALASLTLAILSPYVIVSLVFLWISLSLALVSIAYIYDIPSLFRKNEDGKIVWWIRWGFIPFLLGVKGYNAWVRRNDSVPPIQKINEHIYLSRRLFQSDLDFLQSNQISCIVDVTAEFAGLESAMTDKHFSYLNIPVLDHKVPNLKQLQHALNWIHTQISCDRKVVIHCALGRGRSVFVVAAYLLSQDPDLTPQQVMQRINGVRSTARLNPYQDRMLNALRKKKSIQIGKPTWLIVNPVAGKKLWDQYESSVIRTLTRKYALRLLYTDESTPASVLTEKAIAQGADKIIACGGDGTVTEVASQLVNQNIQLGILPFGTANVLAHVLYGIESKFSPVEKACDVILRGEHQKIDTARCNDHLMLLVLGIGLEEKMLSSAKREDKNKLGQMAYLTGFFNAAVAEDVQTLEVSYDHQEAETLAVHSYVVANTAPFSTILAQGNGFPEPDDGLLHVTYLDQQESLGNRLFALSDLTLTSLGAQQKSKIFQSTQAKHIRIQTQGELEYSVDGEVYKTADALEVSIHPQSLNVFICSQA